MSITALLPRFETPVALCGPDRDDSWFTDDPGKAEAAKTVCRRCPIREACLREALDRNERWGIWGGTTAAERVAIRSRPRRLEKRAADLTAASTFGERVVAARRARGWRQEDVTARIGATRSWLSDLERGAIGRPDGQLLVLLAAVLEVDLDALRGGPVADAA